MARTITLRDFILALKKDGPPKIKGSFTKYDESKVDGVITYDLNKPVGACALGRAAINLKAQPEDINDMYYRFVRSIKGLEAYESVPDELDVVQLNDGTDMSIPQIAAKIRSELSTHLDVPMGEILNV